MALSIFVAKLLAVLYISAGIAAVSGKMDFRKIVDDFERSPGLTFMSGFMALVFGALLLHYHNRWIKHWTVLITIIGWMSFLKGVMLIAFPQSISYFKGWYKNTRGWGVFMIAIGLVFAYLGFLK